MGKRYLITSALPYINGIKHLGNLIGSMLPADVYARFLRGQGEEVLYICGTDDHGAPAEIAAEKAGLPVAQYCENMYETQAQIYETFNIAFDYFGKTATKNNEKVTQAVFLGLDKNDYITEKPIQQYYSVADKRFLSDRFIVGTCPHCQYEKARGDQCDGCNHLLNPTELISPKSALNPSDSLELRETHHAFLNLPKLQNTVKEWTNGLAKPSKLVAGIIKKWLEVDLMERCISRDLEWGVPVPKEGFEGKVFYVWFDAPNGYISITQDWAEQTDDANAWQRWWQDADNVHYTQFMAKDNVPFHAVFWPAMILGSGEKYKTVDVIKGFNWLTYEGGKFSTSNQRGVFTDTALELFPSDYWRYYLMANAPESSDADFTFEDFAKCINSDLNDMLGNFVSRVLAMVEKHFDSRLPPKSKNTDNDKALMEKTASLIEDLTKAHHELRYREAMKVVRALWALGNEYISELAPWKLVKTDREQAGHGLRLCLHLIRTYAITVAAIMPETANKLMELLGDNMDPGKVSYERAADFDILPEKSPVAGKTALFEKVLPEKVAALTEQFKGE